MTVRRLVVALLAPACAGCALVSVDTASSHDGGRVLAPTIDVIDAAGEQPTAGCVPETDREICARQNKTCGTFSSNDNCGNWRTVDDCGFGVVCEPPLICGWCNRCCMKETDTEFCERLGVTCGNLTAQDNCGGWRSVAACGGVACQLDDGGIDAD